LLTRKSPRLQKKKESGKAVVKLTQELMARKCGIIDQGEALEQMTLQKYLDLYHQPLSDNSVQAIMKLTEVATEKSKKKKKAQGVVKGTSSRKKIKKLLKSQRGRQEGKTRTQEKFEGEGDQGCTRESCGLTGLGFSVVVSMLVMSKSLWLLCRPCLGGPLFSRYCGFVPVLLLCVQHVVVLYWYCGLWLVVLMHWYCGLWPYFPDVSAAYRVHG
jgi:hypothetical protein